MAIYSSNQQPGGKQQESHSVAVSPERLAAATAVPPSRSSKQRRESVSDQISNAVEASLKQHTAKRAGAAAMELPTLADRSAAASVA